MKLFSRNRSDKYAHQSTAEFGSFWPRQRALNTKLNAFMLTLPPVTAISLYSIEEGETTTRERDATRYALLHAYSGCFAAKIQLHGVFADELPSEHQLILEAAHDIANIIRLLGDLSPRAACFFAVVRRSYQIPYPNDMIFTASATQNRAAELDDCTSSPSPRVSASFRSQLRCHLHPD